MLFTRVAHCIAIFLALFSAGIAAASQIGQEIANQVSVTSYQH
jgi:hypothetical protein